MFHLIWKEMEVDYSECTLIRIKRTISFQIKRTMIVGTGFPPILNQMEFHFSSQRRKVESSSGVMFHLIWKEMELDYSERTLMRMKRTVLHAANNIHANGVFFSNYETKLKLIHIRLMELQPNGPLNGFNGSELKRLSIKHEES